MDYNNLNYYYEKFMSEFENGKKIKISLENIETPASRFKEYLEKEE